MLLDIEIRIGELAAVEPKAKTKAIRNGQPFQGSLTSRKKPKYKRLGMNEKRMHQSQKLRVLPRIKIVIGVLTRFGPQKTDLKKL